MHLLVLLIAALLLGVIPAPAAENPRRPNIVFFLADDLGTRDLGCYGSTFYETPHLDRLTKQGIRFTQAYAACPVCSPTRASILTGKYPQRTGISDYIGAPQPGKWMRNTRHLPAPYKTHLALEEITLAETLKAAGYATFFAGKWHLGSEPFWPEHQGFDINMGGIDRGGPYGGNKYFSPYGNPRLPDGPDGEHLPDRLATEAAKFIQTHKDKPFLVYFPFYSVHVPLMARPDLKAKYEAKRAKLTVTDQFADEPPRKVRLTQDHAVYAGMVEAMDLAVGKVLAKLDELGLTEDTIVIFTSDNGGVSTSEGFPTSNRPFRAGKGWLYEGGIREPLIIRYPRVVKAPGTTNDTRVTSPDFFPTLLEVAGLALQPDLHQDGRSFLAALKGEHLNQDRALFWHYPHYGNQGGSPGAAILEGNWKLIEWFDTNRTELFDLAADPSETTNLADQHPDHVQSLRTKLHAWQREVRAQFSTPNAAFDPDKPPTPPAPKQNP